MRPRWWFGGVAATGVACLVAPFDLVKTHMQTQVVKKGMIETSRKVIKLRGRNVILLFFSIASTDDRFYSPFPQA